LTASNEPFVVGIPFHFLFKFRGGCPETTLCVATVSRILYQFLVPEQWYERHTYLAIERTAILFIKPNIFQADILARAVV
jgi:hypothetical protein